MRTRKTSRQSFTSAKHLLNNRFLRIPAQLGLVFSYAHQPGRHYVCLRGLLLPENGIEVMETTRKVRASASIMMATWNSINLLATQKGHTTPCQKSGELVGNDPFCPET